MQLTMLSKVRERPRRVAVGEFDGVHLGHREVIRGSDTVLTFEPHPLRVVRPEAAPRLLTSLETKAELIAGPGVEELVVIPFDDGFAHETPEEFVDHILVGRLRSTRVSVGENFRFGHRAAGDVALLAELGDKYDFTAEGVPLLADGEVKISSSLIRQKLADGDVTGASEDLGRPHRVEGVVVPGHRRGRALGFPTANLETFPHTAIPADGVYAGWLSVLGEQEGQEYEEARWPAAISVGANPTFDGRERVVEAYALDRDDLELYGVHVGVDFAARLRGMERFSSADALAEQMRHDIDQARVITVSGAG